MTIDEAIKHAEEIAEKYERHLKLYENMDDDLFRVEKNECKDCAEEHRQLAGWLKELKQLREQEPCEDAISRRAAIDAILKIHPADTEYDCTLYDKVDIMYVLKDLPPVNPQESKTGHWIPVSERLPEDFQRVLVTIVNYNGDKVVRVAEYSRRTFRIKENYEQWEVGENGLLAWMPLPEPYKVESEG